MEKFIDANLFSNLDSSVEEGVKNDFFGKVREQRTRPVLNEEAAEMPAELPQIKPEPQPMMQADKETAITSVLQAYSHEEVQAAATEYFKGDTLAANVWMNKYALKDSEGNIYERTPDDMHHHLASEVARIENKYPNPIGGRRDF